MKFVVQLLYVCATGETFLVALLGTGADTSVEELRNSHLNKTLTDAQLVKKHQEQMIDAVQAQLAKSETFTAESFLSGARLLIPRAVFERCVISCRPATILEEDDRKHWQS